MSDEPKFFDDDDGIGYDDDLLCENCNGTGTDKYDGLPCQECDGRGWFEEL